MKAQQKLGDITNELKLLACEKCVPSCITYMRRPKSSENNNSISSGTLEASPSVEEVLLFVVLTPSTLEPATSCTDPGRCVGIRAL
jgi:hypothetical protein